MNKEEDLESDTSSEGIKLLRLFKIILSYKNQNKIIKNMLNLVLVVKVLNKLNMF